MSKHIQNREPRDVSPRIPPESELALEILNILVSKDIFDSLSTESENIYENLKTMTFLRLLHDDIILRLCKISDTTRDARGAPMIIKKLKKTSVGHFSKFQVAKQALEKLQEYTSKLKPRRDKRIAHIGDQSSREVWGPTPDLNKAICAAVKLVDLLNGGICQYKIIDKNLRDQLSACGGESRSD